MELITNQTSFFDRKKKLTAQAMGQPSQLGQLDELRNRLAEPPRFQCPVDSVDVKVKPKSLDDSQIGPLLNGLNDAYGDAKDPKADMDISKKEAAVIGKKKAQGSSKKEDQIVLAKKKKSSPQPASKKVSKKPAPPLKK